jgi:hypothetical protein
MLYTQNVLGVQAKFGGRKWNPYTLYTLSVKSSLCLNVKACHQKFLSHSIKPGL